MSNNSIVEHRANYYFLELREEFLIICKECSYKKEKSKASPYCKALILAILESWTNDKRGKGEDLAIYMSYPQWITAMYGMFGRNVIIDSLEELLGEGLISREAYKMFGRDTYQYRLNYKELNKRLKLLPEKDPHDKHPKKLEDTSLQINATSLKVNGSDLQVNASGLKVNDDQFKSKRNIESTKKPIDSANSNLSSDRLATGVASQPATRISSSKTTKPKTTKPLPEEPTLSEKAKVVWDVWLQMPWNKDIPPKLTPIAAKHCELLANVEISTDIMFKVRNFANKNDQNGFYKGKAWTLGNVVTEYPKWKSSVQDALPVEPEKPKKTKITPEYLASLPL